MKRVARTISLPAPVGGWNARDPLGAMPPADAVVLENWIPRTGECELRPGYVKHATGFPASVQSLLAFNGASASKLYAVASRSIYDITSSGAIGAAVVSITSATPRMEYANMATSGGQFMIAVNGTDSPLLLDAANVYGGGAYSWIRLTASSTPAITGVAPDTLTHIHVFKRRVWFIQKDSLTAWYLPTDSVGGAATSFNFRGIAKRGGYLVAMHTWTIDAGEGVDDHLVIVTSEGEVIVYKGTDPASDATWALVGVWLVGAPVGKRCFTKFGGDVLLLGMDGILPLAQALQSSQVNPSVKLSDKIQTALTDAVTTYAAQPGWELFPMYRENLLMVNVPVGSGMQQQYVMNTITRNWCRFTGWPAECWAVFNLDAYFGASTYVGKAFVGNADAGTNIVGTAMQAFNYCGKRTGLKRWVLGRPLLRSNGSPAPQFTLAIDYDLTLPVNTQVAQPSNAFTWDVSRWNSGATWGGSLSQIAYWRGLTGVGYACAPQLSVIGNGVIVNWVATDLVFEEGEVL